ncbi:hypothetical protein JEQ21_06765 [Streptococcus sp. 121]|uniref:hypothetical protein n=1 Tax=Streptococcus sp. 121 TaxID=2797637 RepID=UPI0018F0BF7C|nr:hypothetical protein [Streptococcus sp. 121]MBJ6746157.1 hypothetical protein [Streptococcus sp. 121]
MTNQVNLNNFAYLQFILTPSHPSEWVCIPWSQAANILIEEITDHLSLSLFFDCLQGTNIKHKNYSDAYYFLEEHLTILLAYDATQPNKGITVSMSVETLNYLTKAYFECFNKEFDIFEKLQELHFLVSIQKLSLC